MDSQVAQPTSNADAITRVTNKKISALTKIQRAIKRVGNTNFSKRVAGIINSLVQSSWSLGRTVGRLCWVGGCYAILVLFPLAMEVDREQTLMEIQNRERERMVRKGRN